MILPSPTSEPLAHGANGSLAFTPKRSRWHRLDLLLAGFALLTVCASLTLNHRLLAVYTHSLVIGEHFAEVRRRAGAANAPGNDVFDTHDVPSERARLVREELQFAASLDAVRALLPGSEAGFDQAQRAMDTMSAEAEQIFVHFENGQPQLAGARMASMDRKYGLLNDALGNLEQAHYALQFARAKNLLRLEYGIAFSVLLMVGAAACFGQRLSRQVRASESERLRYTRELELLNREHTAALAQVGVLDAAVRSAANAILITDKEGRISWVNPATVALTGYSEAELLGTALSVGSAETHGPSLRLGGAAGWEGQVVSRRKDGRTIVEEQTIAPVLGASGAIDHFVAIRRDVTRQKQAEEELNVAHAELRLILDSLTAILVGFDDEGRVCTWNAHAERFLEIPAAQALGKSLGELALPLESGKLVSALERCMAEERDQRLDDVPYERGGTGPGYLGISFSPMRTADGSLHGCLLLARDITEKRSLEAQLARAQKLESLGQLAAGIAHEINTPTQFVSDNTSFLKSSLAELTPLLAAGERLRHSHADSPEFQALVAQLIAAAGAVDIPYTLNELPKAIEDSLGGLERIAQIVRAMKEFSHPGSGSMETADLNRCVQSTVTVARNEWKYVATMQLELDPSLPRLLCYPQDLSQVVLNMIVNAAHAIQDARSARKTDELGKITVRTRASGNELELRISDTGCGIPEAIRARVFDPFFTTKVRGKGTGQGLAIAHHVVVDKHGGRIDVESQVGVGTTFVVRLPLAGTLVTPAPVLMAAHP